MFEGEQTFVVEDIQTIVKESVDKIIGNNAYQAENVSHWTTAVSEAVLVGLTKMKKPFKYIVMCSIMQRVGGGLHTASSCFWDSATDGTCTVRWENKTMHCIVTVFGLAI